MSVEQVLSPPEQTTSAKLMRAVSEAIAERSQGQDTRDFSDV